MRRIFAPRLKILLPAGFLALTGVAPGAFAYTVTTGGVTAGDGSGLTTAVGSAIVLDFNSLSAGTTGSFATAGVALSGSGSVASGSLPGAPTGDSTNYLAISGSETLTSLSSTNNYLGVALGSTASSSSISLVSGGSTVATITGADVAAAGGTTSYVNIYDLPSYSSVVFFTPSASLAADNVAIGTVPEPGTLALLGAGLLGLAIIRRHKAVLVSIRGETPVFPRYPGPRTHAINNHSTVSAE